MRKVAVVPSNRMDSLSFALNKWGDRGGWDHLIIVLDSYERFAMNHEPPYPYTVYNWEDIEACLNEKWDVFSRRDSAIRSFGFLKAYQHGAGLIATFDDDCITEVDDWMGAHEANMVQSRWVSTVPGLRVRGLPYNRSERLSSLNIGLWTNVPDLDGPSGLTNPIENFRPPHHNWIVPRQQYVPMCGMNLAFTRDLVPCMWFPLMGQHSPYSRFDDIWCGVICKHVCDHIGLSWSVGEPFVTHTRASDPIKNLVKEAPGIETNEEFWRVIDSIDLSGNVFPKECMLTIGRVLQERGGYYNRLGIGILKWLELLDEAQDGVVSA